MDYSDIYDFNRDTLADIPLRGAARYGAAPALAFFGSRLVSYSELERLSRRAAALLQSHGIKKGDRVAILSENRPEWGIATFAIARAGAVSVPILTDFTPEQISNILKHSGAKSVFVSSKMSRKLLRDGTGSPAQGGAQGGKNSSAENAQSPDFSPAGLDAISIESLSAPRLDAAVEDMTPGFRNVPVKSEDIAAIVYTSGTTGRSKGVLLQHRNFLADALACHSVVVLNEKDVCLSILPLAHTYEYTIGFIIPMMSGSSIYYLDKPPAASVLLPALAALRPSIMLSVPLVIEKIYRQAVKPSLEKIPLYKSPLFRPLLNRIAGRKLYKTFGGRMRFFGIGGAPLDPEVEDFLIAAHFPYAIGYGLTETAPIIAAAKVGTTRTKMAGLALGDADIRLVPEDGSAPICGPGPAGYAGGEKEAHRRISHARNFSHAVGEIQVRGAMVGPLYYKDPERSAEALTADGYFRTGDLGCYDEYGRLFVRGRLKTMILGASGENIYPEEIEAVINSSPYVAESLVYGDTEGLTALIELKPEIVKELEARVQKSREEAEDAVGALLERIKAEANSRLAAFSRIKKVREQPQPFEKTPTQKIKRFLYPSKRETV